MVAPGADCPDEESASRSRWSPEVDARQSREVHRYYEPFQTSSTIPAPVTIFQKADAVNNHTPRSSHDKALTAFCQLTALRLGVRRALLVFFDAKQGYVLAEATKSLSLQDEGRCIDTNDELWLGHCIIPRGFNVCERTFAKPVDLKGQVDVVEDLRTDSGVGNDSYVAGIPAARFYAGIPIAPRKAVVGVLCVLDDRPRRGMRDEELAFMTEMSETITEHLEVQRVRLEYRRGTQMVAGMSEFIQATSSRTGEPTGAPLDENLSHACPTDDQTVAGDDSAMTKQSQIDRAVSQATDIGDLKQPLTLKKAPLNTKSSSSDSDAGPSVQSSFQAAATIIHRALEVDVYFLDASATEKGALVDEPDKGFHVAGPAAGSASASATADEHDQATKIAESDEKTAHCKVLGHAVGKHGHNATLEQMPQQFLRKLLRRYRRGKIWSFDEDGLQVATDASSAGSETNTGSGSATSDLRKTTVNKRQERRQRHRADDAATIQKLYPGVRSLALMPIWDHVAEKWRAAVVLATFSPLRTFSDDDELSFMTAFCDVILADAARRDAEATLRNKTEFTAGITHELRTPLHGILGTVEHLYDEVQSSVAAKMVSQIDLCGRTLLDVVDHLLDFSEANQHATNEQSMDPLSDSQQSSSMRTPSTLSFKGSGQPTPGSEALLSNVMLNEVTEEAVDATTYSYLCTFDRRRLQEYRVTTIVEVDQILDKHWQVRISLGAWRRVCMNLVGNALKYTTEGYIHVSLKQRSSSKSSGKKQVVLRVSDTGRGMSQSFMANSLFKAFSQEKSHENGAGLGMNIVAKIVQVMKGKIDVQSTPGKGTTVTVVVPVQFTPKVVEPNVRSHDFQSTVVQLLGAWDSDIHSPGERGHRMLLGAIKKSLEELSITVQGTDSTSTDASLNLICEGEMYNLLSKLQQAEDSSDDEIAKALAKRPLVIICKTYQSSRRLEKSIGGPGTTFESHIEYLVEPCGPSRIEAAIRSCLEYSVTLQRPRRPILKNRLVSSEWRVVPSMSREPSSPEERETSRDQSQTGPLSLPKQAPRSSVAPSADEAIVDSPTGALSIINPMLEQLGQIRADARTPPPTRTASGRIRSLDILIVDDNNINTQLLLMYCRKQGHRSQSAVNGQEAVNVYTWNALSSVDDRYEISGSNIQRLGNCPQVILMDINMPILDGYEATQQIRAFEKKMASSGRRALIIAMTGLGSAEVRQRAFASGIDIFFQKPVKLRELTKTLEKHFPVEAG